MKNYSSENLPNARRTFPPPTTGSIHDALGRPCQRRRERSAWAEQAVHVSFPAQCTPASTPPFLQPPHAHVATCSQPCEREEHHEAAPPSPCLRGSQIPKESRGGGRRRGGSRGSGNRNETLINPFLCSPDSLPCNIHSFRSFLLKCTNSGIPTRKILP